MGVHADTDELSWRLFDNESTNDAVSVYGMRLNARQLYKITRLLPEEWNVIVVSKVVGRVEVVED